MNSKTSIKRHNNKAFLFAGILLSFIFLNKELTAQGPGRNAPLVLAADDTAVLLRVRTDNFRI